MKILYLTNLTVPYRMKFFNYLGEKCDLTVVVERNSATNRENVWLNSVKSTNFKLIHLNGFKIGEESSFSFKIIKFLKKDFDLIVIGGYSTLTAMFAIVCLKILKIPFILNADGGTIKHTENKVIKKLKNFFISSASFWLTTSKEAVEYLTFYGAKKKNIYIYPFSSIEENEIKYITDKEKIKFKNKLSINIRKKMILSVGQIIPRKGFDILIHAFSKLDDNKYELYIVGGKITEFLSSIINKNKLTNIHFVEFVNKEKLSEFYSAADLFVLPSRFDIWGLVINEALAYSLPIISSNQVGAAKEILDNLYIFESENAQELKNLIQSVAVDKSKLNLMSNENYLIAKAYTIEKMADAHFEIFKEIVKEES